MGMIMAVVMIVVMVMIIIVRVMFMIIIVRVMFMIVIVIMPLIVTLLLMTLLLIVILLMTLLLMTLLMIVTLLLMTLLLVVTMIVIFSEGRYRKRQSTCYRADEREFANHLVFLCYWWRLLGLRTCAGLHWREPTLFPLHNLLTTGFDPKPRPIQVIKMMPPSRGAIRAATPAKRGPSD
jgi:hypothetical protein